MFGENHVVLKGNAGGISGHLQGTNGGGAYRKLSANKGGSPEYHHQSITPRAMSNDWSLITR